jgi:NAD(P)-dependent dehydrogenase (short-subunit alcohol dehydrogenase family)
MVAASERSGNGNSSAAAAPDFLSTLPGPDFNWRVTLTGKVIASKYIFILSGPLDQLSSLQCALLVTGANQGIGLGIAEVCLANDAACIFSLDISEPAEPFAALLKRYPGKLEFQHCDVTSEGSVSSALDNIVAKKGRFDGMVANAGATKHQPALDFTSDQVKRLFELNVFGAWNCATAAARIFVKLGCKGSIVFTASMTSYRPNRVSSSTSQ